MTSRSMPGGVMTLAAMLAGLVLFAAPAEASATAETPRPLFWQVDPDGPGGEIEVGDVVAGSSVTLLRHEEGVSFELTTTGLTQAHGYTVWFFSYDNPEACRFGRNDPDVGNRCTVADLFLNPAALGSMMWGRAGGFVDDDPTTFAGSRPVNTLPCVTEPVVVDEDCKGVLFGHGLHNPLGAEIHFVLRDHGPAQEGLEDEQVETINGGCDLTTSHGFPVFLPGWGSEGDYACFDPQGNNNQRP